MCTAFFVVWQTKKDLLLNSQKVHTFLLTNDDKNGKL